MSSATAHFAAQQSTTARLGDLALALQEPFTVAVRLRANRQSTADAMAFRQHVKALLGSADRDARARGYDPEYVKLAVFAYIAFLDETVLNASLPMFQEWTRQPLQEEIFGEHMAGETFFRYVGDLMGRQDSTELADVLEVYLLCLLLGYRGKYGMSDPASVQGLTMSLQQKIQRIRGTRTTLPTSWVLPQNEAVPASVDPWLRRLLLMLAGTAGVALILFLVYWITLGRGAAGIATEAARLMGG
jgi:type VI secretion system protein ImpK